jgi:hypothetical protein
MFDQVGFARSTMTELRTPSSQSQHCPALHPDLARELLSDMVYRKFYLIVMTQLGKSSIMISQGYQACRAPA